MALSSRPVLLPPGPSALERTLGVPGSSRRTVSTFALSFLLASGVRNACFSPWVFGPHLMRNLSPVTDPSVRWSWILLVRAIDIAMGLLLWTRVSHGTDAVLFGGLLAALSRVSVYAFEQSYFLLTYSTLARLLMADVVSLGAAFSLFAILIPQSLPPRRELSSWEKLVGDRALLVNVVLSYTFATTMGAFFGYTLERLGGMAFVKAAVHELVVPAIYASDTLTSAEMIKNPTIVTPVLRSFLRPLHLERHLGHSFVQALLSIPLVILLPTYSPLRLFDVAFTLVAPASTLILWDVLPMSLPGALGVGAVLGFRAGLITSVIAWVLEELRSVRRVERNTVVVVQGAAVELVETTGDVEVDIETEDGATVLVGPGAKSTRGGARRRV